MVLGLSIVLAAQSATSAEDDTAEVDAVLWALLADDDDTRNETDDPRILDDPLGRLILDSLNGDEDSMRRLAQSDDPRLSPLIQKSLAESWLSARLTLTRMMAMSPDERFAGELIVAARDWNKDVRTIAIDSLRQSHDSDAVRIALRDALSDEFWWIRELAAWGIFRIGTAAEFDFVLPLTLDIQPSVRLAALWAAGKTGGERAVPAHLRALSSTTPRERLESILSLQLFAENNESTVRSVAALADDEDVEVRRTVATFLGRDESIPLGLPALAVMLTDDNVQVRENAALSLAAYGAEAEPALMTALGDSAESVREAAAQSLESYSNVCGMSFNSGLSGNLGLSATAQACDFTEPLTRLLESPDPLLRRRAIAVAGVSGATQLSVPLLDLAKGWNLPDRVEATSALWRMTRTSGLSHREITLPILGSVPTLFYIAILFLSSLAVLRVAHRRLLVDSNLQNSLGVRYAATRAALHERWPGFRNWLESRVATSARRLRAAWRTLVANADRCRHEGLAEVIAGLRSVSARPRIRLQRGRQYSIRAVRRTLGRLTGYWREFRVRVNAYWRTFRTRVYRFNRE